MTDVTPAQAEDRLWDEIKDHRTGMLMEHEPHVQHAQPMTAFVEREASRIWFFTRTDTDLAKDLERGGSGMFTYQGKDLQACIAGKMTLERDQARIDRYWNAHVAAWYPDGKDDPRLTMICFEAQDAQVWLTETGPIRYAFEVAKANMTGKTPDLGARQDLRFN